MKNRVLFTVIIALVSISFIQSLTFSQQITFTNVVNQLGINHTSNKDFFVGGVSFCDFDNDGLDDLCFSNINGAAIQVLKNETSLFTDVSSLWNISTTSRSQTLIWADFDNDGDKDFLVTLLGKENKLFRNDGNNVFVEITLSSGISTGNSNSTAAAWGDYDNDGWIDLYIGTRSDGEGNYLFHNNQNGTFNNVTEFAGVQNIGKKALAISFIDYDNDGWQDIYVADDLRLGNTLFRNNSDGTFTDVSIVSHSDLVMDAMGIAIGDYDNNDALDMYISNLPIVGGNYLLMNNSDGTFTEVAASLGLEFNKVSWGVNFFDYDNDTDLDLFVCASDGFYTGHSGRENTLYNNNGDGTFTQAIGSGLDVDTSYSYGSAIGDYNNDGWIDLAILNANGTKSELWKNNGGTNNWIKILLQGTLSNRDGIGSKMEFYVQGKKFIRTTHCGISYQSQDSFTNTIGIGAATVIDSLIIRWPSKTVDILTNVTPNQLLTIVEGSYPRPDPISFINVALSMGINNTYNTDYFAGGISLVDFNNDGLDDVTLSSATGEKIYAYRNKGTSFKIVYQGLITDTLRSKSVVWVDYDNDGDKDLYISNEDGINRLYKKDPGTYSDATLDAGLPMISSTSTSACWADYDNDGWLDLYVGTRNDLEGNYLYHNNGNGTFTDITELAGVAAVGTKTLTASFFDYNNDGLQDLYLANDLNLGNILYKNNGDGTFTDVSISSGTNLAFNSMGIAIGDYNSDGWSDIYVTNGTDGNALLKNNSDGIFTNVTATLGLAVNKICWGANFLDYNNDGNLDLFISVSDGPSGRNDSNRENVLYRNNGDGTFSFTKGTGIDIDTSYSYGNAIGDLNNDGYPDIAVLNANGTNTKLWQNMGGVNNWIKISLKGTVSNKDAVGSLVEIYAGGKKQIRTTHLGVSFESQNSFIQMLGLGSASVVDSIIVRWPSGLVDIVKNVSSNRLIKIKEGTRPQLLIKKEIETPNEYELKQNYPNPFNPSTRIEYSLVKDGKVVLEVYDILGEKIAQLVNENKESGIYSVQFDASQLPSGIYLYKIKTDDFVKVKKMILLK